MSTYAEPRFHDETAARQHLEAIRWPDGPVCAHCGSDSRISLLQGKSHRPGLYFCGECRKQFSVTVGTVFERSKVPLHKWLLATHLLCSSKKGVSSHQIHRTLGVTYKTAWFMTHRIREAMYGKPAGQLGGPGSSGIVEADETYFGKTKGQGKGGHLGKKQKIVALLERGGEVRAFHVDSVNAKTLKPILEEQIAKAARLMTDTAPVYKGITGEFASHETVNHNIKEYARGDVTTNSVEGYFGILKRGISGVYQHVSEEHLIRYCNEFSFRYSNHRITDSERADKVLKGIGGKRLTYRRINQAQA
ncbi:MAG TPA: IS1595 family transposase [Gammaproteobacteria bacterium]